MRSKRVGAACALVLGLWAANGQAATLITEQTGEATGGAVGGFGPLPAGDYELVLTTSQTVTANLSLQGDVLATLYCPGSTEVCEQDLLPFGDEIQKTGTKFIFDQTVPGDSTIGNETFQYSDAEATFDIFTDSTTPFTYAFDIFSSPAPEPGTWALVLLGVFSVGALIRRRRKPSPASALAAYPRSLARWNATFG